MEFVIVSTDRDLPRAAVASASLRRHHPGVRPHLFVVDHLVRRSSDVGEHEIEITPEELSISDSELQELTGRYTGEELVDVLAPRVLQVVVERTSGPVMLVPADSWCLDGLGGLEALAAPDRFVVVPRRLRPVHDLADTVEIEVARRGLYDARTLVVGPSARPMLSWWQQRLRHHGGRDEPPLLDLATLYWAHETCRDPGVGVAPCNAASRPIRRDAGGRWEIDGDPVRLVRFGRLGESASDLPGALVDEHRAALEAAGWRPPVANASTAVDIGSDGIFVDASIKRIARQVSMPRTGPADEPGAPRSAQVPDHLGPAGGRAAIEWSEAHRSLPPGSLSSWAVPAGRPDDPPGVNVIGFANTEAGVGEMARLAVECLEAAGIDYAVFPFTTGGAQREAHPFAKLGRVGTVFDVNLVVLNANHLAQFGENGGAPILADRPTIGYWAWEVESLPADMVASQRYTDEVWGLSTFAARVFERHLDVPVHALTLPIHDRPMASSTRQPGRPVAFLFCFDFLSVYERKNPEGVIEAFCRVARPGEARLVIKSINGELRPVQLDAMRRAANRHPDITVMDGYLDVDRQQALMSVADCYISLHRSEGFGLTVAEAMAMGIPVIVSDYSGTQDFATADTAYLVSTGRSTVPVGVPPYPVGAVWGEPDLDAAARMIRRVIDRPGEADEVGRRGREHVRGTHRPRHRAAFLRERIAAMRHLRAPGVRLATTSSPSPAPRARRLSLRR